jgi:hypothetical protein
VETTASFESQAFSLEMRIFIWQASSIFIAQLWPRIQSQMRKYTQYHEKSWFGEPVLLSFPATLITLVVLSQGKTMHYERMTHEEEYVYVFEVQLFVSCVVICFI